VVFSFTSLISSQLKSGRGLDLSVHLSLLCSLLWELQPSWLNQTQTSSSHLMEATGMYLSFPLCVDGSSLMNKVVNLGIWLTYFHHSESTVLYYLFLYFDSYYFIHLIKFLNLFYKVSPVPATPFWKEVQVSQIVLYIFKNFLLGMHQLTAFAGLLRSSPR
jgi:hypothetical protein